jgi:hypothetical protein
MRVTGVGVELETRNWKLETGNSKLADTLPDNQKSKI